MFISACAALVIPELCDAVFAYLDNRSLAAAVRRLYYFHCPKRADVHGTDLL
jgi:hypothetical protein